MMLTFPQRTISGPVSPEPDDNPVKLFPTIQPVIEFPGMLRSQVNTGTLVAAPVPETLLISREIQQSASTAAFAQNLVMLSAGIWRLKILLSGKADFTPVPITAQLFQVLMQVPAGGGVSNPLALLHFAANVPVDLQVDWLFNLAADGYILTLQAPATAAAQTYDAWCTINATRVG